MTERAPQRSHAGLALSRRMRELGISQRALGSRLGRGQAWVSEFLLAQTEVTLRRLWLESPENIENLLRELEWTRDEFMLATGISLPTENPHPSTKGRFLRVRHSAAAGKPEVSDIWVSPEHDRPGAQAFLVEGHSMVPTLQEGEVVFVDVALKTLLINKIYVVLVRGDGYAIKRAKKGLDGRWQLRSDNPAYPDLAEGDCEIVGMAYWKQPRGEAI